MAMCPNCGRDHARGQGGTKCWGCYKRVARGLPLDAPYERPKPPDLLKRAALQYADADDDSEYRNAVRSLNAAARRFAASQRSRRRAR
jgi:hypothetical protein